MLNSVMEVSESALHCLSDRGDATAGADSLLGESVSGHRHSFTGSFFTLNKT